MRNLLNFIWSNHNFWLFLLLETVAISLLINYNRYQNVRFLTVTNEVSGSMHQAVNNFSEYVSLRETNELLAEENAVLKTRFKDSYLDGFRPF
jgi:rod shape-determining protein MreC